jgi:hypothetical protein
VCERLKIKFGKNHHFKEFLQVTAPRHKWRGFTDSEDPGQDNHREMPVESADF